MTTQPDQPVQLPQLPPFDPSNPLLNETPTAIGVATVDVQDGGKRIALTMRTASTTFTVFLSRDFALAVANSLNREAAQMRGLIVPNGVLR